MGSLNRVELPALLLLLLVGPCVTFDVSRLSNGPSVLDEERKLTIVQKEELCKEVPPRLLRQVLGSAYNEYYMSFEAPTTYYITDEADDSVNKRSQGLGSGNVTSGPFSVKSNLAVVLSDEPAWKIDFSKLDEDSRLVRQRPAGARTKRQGLRWQRKPREHEHAKGEFPDSILDAIGMSGDSNFRWHCEAPLHWSDLGNDYFPRYILSVDCNNDGCQGRRFRCEGRSFAIKVLRRRKGVCAPGFSLHKNTIAIGADQMPESLRELWIWELRSVTFCCVCKFRW